MEIISELNSSHDISDAYKSVNILTDASKPLQVFSYSQDPSSNVALGS